MDELITLLQQAPDSQLDSCVKPKIAKWSSPPTSLEVLEVVDEVVHSSLGSDFTVRLLNLILSDSLKRENTTLEQIVPQAHWRNR